MSEYETQFDNWREVIKNYIDCLGDSEKKDDYLDEVIANHYYKKICSVNRETTDKRLEKEVNKASKVKATARSKNKLKDIYSYFVDKKWIENDDELFSTLEQKNDFYNIWINWACLSPEGILPATHVAKISHSSNSASSIFDLSEDDICCYLSTCSLREKIIDGAYPDAKFSKIVKFFMLTHNSELLAHEIKSGNGGHLSTFSKDNVELQLWLENFNKIIKTKPKANYLIKQVYFPVKINRYHLLPILNSSSLLHHIFLNLFEKEARKSSKKISSSIHKGKYLSETQKTVPNLTKLLTTQSQPQNVSVLNGKRGGIIRLFSAQPPTWKSQLKPPFNRKSLFDAVHNSTITTEMDYLRDFLVRFKRLDLSIKDPKRKRHLKRWVDNIIDECLFYIASIQNLPAGWSETDNIQLKPEHQFLLDSYRLDDTFQTNRQSTNWQAVVRTDFATWMNWQLKGKDKLFTPQAEHNRFWKKQFEQPLREHMEPIEQEVKHMMRAVV